MKYIVALLFLVCLNIFDNAKGQSVSHGSPEGKTEVYFFFRIASRSEINEITRQISIDNVRNDTVWAYANMEEFLRFSKNGYDITLLPSPGDVPNVVMKDNIQLSTLTAWNFYPTYEAYESLMTEFQTTYPSLCQVTTIATLSSGRKILVAKISDNVATDESEPEFLYTSSIHGDETTGYILMLHLMDYLLSNYGTNPEATELINNLEIYINPLANPDGTYYGGNSTVNGARRSNINNVDLNRNYPDPVMGQHPDGKAWQPETVAFMDFAAQHHFVAAANFHGGIEVVNYPWDCKYALSADDIWWQYVSREYVDTVHLHSPLTYMDDLTNGITNGAVWYIVYGGRQDYMNYWHHCREVTIELSTTKLLPASQLETHWNYNWRSLILYMKQARYGIHGTITDALTGNPIAAKVFINGHDFDNSECYSSANNGDYHRLLKAGTYTLTVTAPCYQTQTFANIVVTDKNTITLDIQLEPGVVVSTTPVSGITGSTALSGGSMSCEGSGMILAKGVCWSTSALPTIAGNHTNEGTGTGAFTSSISGLTATTLYHVRAYVTNTIGTAYGEELTFTTGCGTISLPLSENFGTSILPACWTTQISGAGAVANWTVSNTAFAGGSAYEMKSTYQNISPAITRLVSIPLNTVGMTQLNLSFKHTLDDYGPGATLRIQSSTNGTTWTNEAWSLATVSNSTLGPATVNTTVVNNLNSPNTYIAFCIEGNLYQYDYWYIDNVNISNSTKTINMSLFLEGLFNGATMNKSQNSSGNQFSGTVADQVTVELHNSTSPYSLTGSPYTVDVNTDGTATFTIPGTLTGNYYIVIKHRNSIETWSGMPVSLNGPSASFDYTGAASQAYGNNLKFVSGKYVIYSGDVSQDGIVNESDAQLIGDEAANFNAGYISSDINGDGMIDAADLIVVDNNASGFAGKVTP